MLPVPNSGSSCSWQRSPGQRTLESSATWHAARRTSVGPVIDGSRPQTVNWAFHGNHKPAPDSNLACQRAVCLPPNNRHRIRVSGKAGRDSFHDVKPSVGPMHAVEIHCPHWCGAQMWCWWTGFFDGKMGFAVMGKKPNGELTDVLYAWLAFSKASWILAALGPGRDPDTSPQDWVV